MLKDFSASSLSEWSNPSISARLNFRRRARDFHGLPSCKDNPSKSSSATTPSLTTNKNNKKNVNVFLRKLRIEQLNFCFFYEQQPFMKDPVTYVQLALQNTNQRLHKRGSQFRINPNPYQLEHANSLRYQNSNMTQRKTANVSRLHYLAIPRRDLNKKRAKPMDLFTDTAAILN